MTFNPTTNRVPIALLEDRERIALAKWPHGWEKYDFDRKIWIKTTYPGLHAIHWVFRGKPAPKEAALDYAEHAK